MKDHPTPSEKKILEGLVVRNWRCQRVPIQPDPVPPRPAKHPFKKFFGYVLFALSLGRYKGN